MRPVREMLVVKITVLEDGVAWEFRRHGGPNENAYQAGSYRNAAARERDLVRIQAALLTALSGAITHPGDAPLPLTEP